MSPIGRGVVMKLYHQRRVNDDTLIIILRLRCKNDVYNTTFCSVSKEHWDFELRKFTDDARSLDGRSASELNAILDEIHDTCTSYVQELKGTALPSMTRLRTLSQTILGRPQKVTTLSADYHTYIIDTLKRRHWHDKTLDRERYVMRLFLDWAAGRDYNSFDAVSMSQFTTMLNEQKGIHDENLKKVVSSVYRFLQWAKLHGKNVPNEKYSYKYSKAKNTIVYLTKQEMRRIVKYPIPSTGAEVVVRDMRGRPEKIMVRGSDGMAVSRDFLLFLCLTGLRYSELQALKGRNYRSAQQSGAPFGTLVFVADKTDTKREVELNRYASEILEKYSPKKTTNEFLFPRLSGQKANGHMHELAKLCEINEPVAEMRMVNGEKQETLRPKYEYITSHTGRRTFVCQALLAGIPPEMVTQWTGHASVEDMRPYIAAASDAGQEGMKKMYDATFKYGIEP